MLHICKSCMTYSGLELWAKKCTKRQCRKVMPIVKFWRRMAKTNDIDDIPVEKRKFIHAEIAEK